MPSWWRRAWRWWTRPRHTPLPIDVRTPIDTAPAAPATIAARMASSYTAQKPGQDATKGAAPKMPFGKGQVSKKAMGHKMPGRMMGRKMGHR